MDDTNSNELLRRHATRVVAALSNRFGAEYLDLVEDAVQDALVSVFRRGSHGGLPADLPSWLYRVAYNRAIDLLRREKRLTELEHEPGMEQSGAEPPDSGDAELELLLLCCHPSLSASTRVALALRLAGGLTVTQIAGALIMTEANVRQLLVRAKRRLRMEGTTIHPRDGTDVEGRLESALDTIYLMFTEGYSAREGERLTRPELCREAIRMCGLLLDSSMTAQPRVSALAALLLFQMARLRAREDVTGELVPFQKQDPSLRSAALTAIAFDLLGRSGRGTAISAYHLEAEIASYHARADSAAATDWDAIIGAYDALVVIDRSPVAALNRAVAVGERDGPLAGLREIGSIKDARRLANYPFYHSARGILLERAGRQEEAKQAFQRVLTLVSAGPVHRFALARLRQAVSKKKRTKRV